jgi:hypothetical protein
MHYAMHRTAVHCWGNLFHYTVRLPVDSLFPGSDKPGVSPPATSRRSTLGGRKVRPLTTPRQTCTHPTSQSRPPSRPQDIRSIPRDSSHRRHDMHRGLFPTSPRRIHLWHRQHTFPTQRRDTVHWHPATQLPPCITRGVRQSHVSFFDFHSTKN